MKILILGLNYSPEKVGIAVYTSGLAETLAQGNNEVHVISGKPYYPDWKLANDFDNRTYNTTVENGVTITRCPLYVPKMPTGARRILHHLSFAASALYPVIKTARGSKFDLVLTVAPSLLASPVAKFAAWLSGAKSWIHVQDFEVEAAFATGLLKGNGVLAGVARWIELRILRSFDRVSSISPQMCKKLQEKGVLPESIFEFRNWSDLSAIKPMQDVSSFRSLWNITTPHIALYAGNIGNKQGIEIIIDTAKLLIDRKDITFVICGNGSNRLNLETIASGMDNIQFHDLQPKESLNQLMGLATIHLLPQMAGAADLVLPSKMTNMLASGRPIVATAEPGTGLAIEVEGCGLISDPGDPQAFGNAIVDLIDNQDLYRKCAENARFCAEKRWSKDFILSKFEQHLQKLLRLESSGQTASGEEAVVK